MQLTTTNLPSQSSELPDRLLSSLQENFEKIGFVRSAKTRFTRKSPSGSSDFHLFFTVYRGGTTTEIGVEPVLQTNFAAVKQITKVLGSGKLIPSIGGAMGLYTPQRSMRKWWMHDMKSADLVGMELWEEITTWGTRFWNLTHTEASTLESLPILGYGPNIEEEAAMRYLVHGVGPAVLFLESIHETRLSADSKHRLIERIKNLPEPAHGALAVERTK